MKFNKEEIIKDKRFIDICMSFGISTNDFEIYDDILLLKTPDNGIDILYILLDTNYNIIGVHSVNVYNYLLTKKEIINKYNTQYSKLSFLSDERFEGMSNPFRNYTIKNMVDLSNIIEYKNIDDIYINGMLVTDNYGASPYDRSSYISLLLYIKFISNIIKDYFYNSYHAKKMGMDYLNIYDYIFRMIYKMEYCIDISIKNNKLIFPKDIISVLGLNNNIYTQKYYRELNCIIDLMLKDRGYLGIKDYRKNNSSNKPDNIVSKADNLLSLLDVSGKGTIELENYFNNKKKIKELK